MELTTSLEARTIIFTPWGYMPLYDTGQKLSKILETILRSNFLSIEVELHFSVNFTYISFKLKQIKNGQYFLTAPCIEYNILI